MSDDLRALDARVRWDLRWHDVTAQQRALADLLLDLTFACGAESVHVARLDDLGRLLGTGRSHVSEFVKQLTGMAIIRVDGTEYRVRPRSSLHEWKVAWRKDADSGQRWLSEMRQANGAQQEWWREEKTIAQTVAEAEARVPVSGTCVPETGTKPTWKAHVDAMRQAIESPSSLAESVPVPKAGTQTVSVQRLTASSKKQLSVEPLQSTEAALMARIAGVVGEDDMARWGGDWRKNWVRRIPSALASALDELDAKRKEGFEPSNPGAWLKDLSRRFAGHSGHQAPLVGRVAIATVGPVDISSRVLPGTNPSGKRASERQI